MMNYIICNNIGEFNTINEKIHEGLRNSVPGYAATKWSDPVIHPEDNRIAIVIEPRVGVYLTQDELNRLEELDETWFTSEDII